MGTEARVWCDTLLEAQQEAEREAKQAAAAGAARLAAAGQVRVVAARAAAASEACEEAVAAVGGEGCVCPLCLPPPPATCVRINRP